MTTFRDENETYAIIYSDVVPNLFNLGPVYTSAFSF